VNLAFLECCPYVIAIVAIWQGPRSFVSLLYLQFIMNTFNLGFNSSSLAEINLGKCHWF
jgi:hypothetical protein